MPCCSQAASIPTWPERELGSWGFSFSVNLIEDDGLRLQGRQQGDDDIVQEPCAQVMQRHVEVAVAISEDVGISIATQGFLHKASGPSTNQAPFPMNFDFSPFRLTVLHVGAEVLVEAGVEI